MSSAYNPAILELGNVSFSYTQGSHVIKDLSFSVSSGAFIGLLGANGSGKSTILKLSSGILKPASGTVTLWAKNMYSFKHKDRAKLICYLPQTLDITVPFRIQELVSMGLYPYDVPPAMAVDEALELVGLRDKAQAYLVDLSGGERRRVFIAMTLVQGAGLLLLDEPLANLDIKFQFELISLLKHLQEERNISVVMALHDINMALKFEKIMLIKNGSILGFGSPEEVLTESEIRNAFDITVTIRQHPEGKAYVYYE
ncbi:MAG: ABC transporter ATP-binding protein [Nitrospiraceae bacterium]|jgi:iron complex transport system ATP-binding protein|nr:MAG: ABC transporter ATP-binding protein [Nitrospiraceae bacterium]